MGSLEKSVMHDTRIALESLERAGSVLWWDRLNAGKVETVHGGWMQLCRPGTPDFIAILPIATGTMVYFIECKSTTGKQKIQQNIFQDNVKTWAIYEVVRDVAQVKKTIENVTGFFNKKLKDINYFA